MKIHADLSFKVPPMHLHITEDEHRQIREAWAFGKKINFRGRLLWVAKYNCAIVLSYAPETFGQWELHLEAVFMPDSVPT